MVTDTEIIWLFIDLEMIWLINRSFDWFKSWSDWFRDDLIDYWIRNDLIGYWHGSGEGTEKLIGCVPRWPMSKSEVWGWHFQSSSLLQYHVEQRNSDLYIQYSLIIHYSILQLFDMIILGDLIVICLSVM